MSLYAIKDEDGELRDAAWDSPNTSHYFHAYTDIASAGAAEIVNKHSGACVVNLVEKPAKVEVSKEEAKRLSETRAGQKTLLGLLLGAPISDYDRLIHAYVNGWFVKQPQRWYVSAPKEWAGDEKTSWFYKGLDGDINTVRDSSRSRTSDEQFTAEEIERYRLGGFEKVGVED